MHKSSFFTGQPIFSQLIRLIPSRLIARATLDYKSDRYCKKFNTHHHVTTMLYACYQHCTSLREVVSGMAACEGRLQSARMLHLPRRSTLSEANIRRPYPVFEHIYYALFHHYRSCLPDSRADKLSKRLVIMDSTTISLFREILAGAGVRGMNGRKKGGIKVHTAIWAKEDMPFLIRLTAAAKSDVTFLREVHLPKGSIAVFDKGFNSFSKFNEWNRTGVSWVSRLRINAVCEVQQERPVSEQERQLGILSDQHIMLGFKNAQIQRVRCRLIHFRDPLSGKELSFITNNRRWKASRVASIYKRRWQIEMLFKRLKQNMPLQYFLGDNENAIKIQIYCALIADLLLHIATKDIQRKWAFSNLASIVRLHLMNYTDLRRFLQNPDRCTIINPLPASDNQLRLLFSG